MTVFWSDIQNDASLNSARNEITEMYVCVGDPADRAAAIAAALVVKTGLTTANFAALLNGDVSGRKLIKNAESNEAITATGLAGSIVLCDASVIRWSTDLTADQTLTSGGTASTAAFQHEIGDAVSA